ncbi:MAG: transglycosylase SLT domain-containing protein [Gemmatimonadota bacterium]|nr:transglycosylase SLT domain-containing protein [Gemmatimonadota bacterium]
MRRSTVDYVHRGDLIRRRERNRRWALGLGFLAALFGFTQLRQRDASASAPPSFGSAGEKERLRNALDSATGELNLAKAELERASRIIHYSTRFRVGAHIVADIYDIALAEGIEPELAFRLVKTESEFQERAVSPVGAVGLTQLMLPTAQYFQKGVTRTQLYDRKTNLRIGFRYLRTLIRERDGDLKLALLTYNRGPVAVNAARRAGLDPANGYERMVMTGYSGTGVVD